MKSKINISNYEQYVLDYLENNLSAELKEEFENFLQQNLQIKEEIEDLFFLDNKQAEFFPNKSNLKKSTIEGIPLNDYLLISKVEKTITESEEKTLNKILSENPQLIDDLNLYKKTKIQPEIVIFQNKELLKHTKIISFNFSTALKVAASVAVLAGLFFIFKPKQYYRTTIALNSKINYSAIDFSNRNENKFIQIHTNQNTYLKNQKVIVKQNQNQVFKDTNSNFEQTPEVIAYQPEIIEHKQIDTKLVHFTNANEQNIGLSYQTQNITKNNQTVKKNLNLKPEDLVNLLLQGVSDIAESDKFLQIEVNRKRKSYGIEINDKVYRVVLK